MTDDDQTPTEPRGKPAPTPALAPSVEDVIAMIEGFTKPERAQLLHALRALYGPPRRG